MAFPGTGVVAIWHDISEDGLVDFREWHNREHMPERIAIDGFLRGRRFVVVEGSPAFFTLYNVRDRAVLASAAYLSRLNSPTEWTRRANTYFSNESRSLCDVLRSAGSGSGGMIGTIRFDCPPEIDDQIAAALSIAVEKAAAMPMIAGAHLCRADVDISSVRTAENDGHEDNRIPRWVVLVEGGDAGSLAAAMDALLSAYALPELGIPSFERGIYRLEHSLGKTDTA